MLLLTVAHIGENRPNYDDRCATGGALPCAAIWCHRAQSGAASRVYIARALVASVHKLRAVVGETVSANSPAYEELQPWAF